MDGAWRASLRKAEFFLSCTSLADDAPVVQRLLAELSAASGHGHTHATTTRGTGGVSPAPGPGDVGERDGGTHMR
ncbi:MAG: hypothetical protein ABEI52_05555, partial [Halobacteriaceae archaeon]